MRSFRNLADAEIALPAPGLVLVGPNGHGKTSFLEALLYLEVFRSFRGARERELVQFGADGFRVEAEVQSQDATTPRRQVSAGYDFRTRAKRVAVDRVVAERLAGAIGHVRGVVLSPFDVELVTGRRGSGGATSTCCSRSPCRATWRRCRSMPGRSASGPRRRWPSSPLGSG